ncbi:MAG: MFS transporter [Desulfobacula sp.]|nr:MFS transporter [Desulfobacula sp.]
MKTDQNKTPWALVFILFGAGILSAFQVGKVPPVLSDIRSDLGVSLFHAGWILSVFNFTGLLLGTCTGIIADTIGHRRLMLTGFVLQIAGCILGSYALSFYGLLGARFLEGAGFLSVIISTPTLIFKLVQSKDMKVALSVWSCYLPAGAALMMVFVPMILTFSTWRGLWQLNAFILAVFAVILFKKTKDIKFTNNKSTKIEPRKMFKDIFRTTTSAGPFLLAFIFITYSLQWLCVMGFLPTLMIEKFGFSKSLASLLTAVMVAVNIFGNLAGGRLLNMGVRRWKLIAFASFIMGSCAIAIYSDTPSFAINYAGCIVFSIFGGLIPASILGGVPLYAPSKRLIGTTNGLVIQGGQSGQVLGPPILAFLVSYTGTWSSGAWLLGSVAILGIILSFMLSKIKHSNPS